MKHIAIVGTTAAVTIVAAVLQPGSPATGSGALLTLCLAATSSVVPAEVWLLIPLVAGGSA